MTVLRRLAKSVPGFHRLYLNYVDFREKRLVKGKTTEDVFTDIYNDNRWHSNESVSGPGSALDQTKAVLENLPKLIGELSIKSILDIPSGDFNWLKNADLGDVDYIGADIVEDIVQKNIQKFEKSNVAFRKLNLLEDDLPKVDLIFCRDCLVHFSSGDVRAALENICRSGSTYLLSTSFPDHTENQEIETGQWRPLNLEAFPFDLPEPIRVINELCTEGDGAYQDKSLCLWRIEAIASKL